MFKCLLGMRRGVITEPRRINHTSRSPNTHLSVPKGRALEMWLAPGLKFRSKLKRDELDKLFVTLRDGELAEAGKALGSLPCLG